LDNSAPSATARQKFECPACGADAHWNAAKQALVCPFCGTESPATLQTRGAETVIVEHDLAAALRDIPDAKRGWQTAKVAVKCQSCQAISVFDPERVGQRCEFCGSSQLVPYEQVKDAFSPESLLPFAVNESRARELVRAWYGRQWLAPNNLNKRALTDTVHGLYLPYWTFDAKAHASWTADSGRFYYDTVNGKRVQKVAWSPAAGELDHVFDDELVPASTGVSAALLRKIEPFPTGTVVPYDPGYLAGWTVERYQIDLVNAAERSRAAMDAKVRALCSDAVPGDTQRNLQVESVFSAVAYKNALLPIWIAAYDYRGKPYRYLVNGVTGKCSGIAPWSAWKITFLVLTIVTILLVILWVAGQS
jgi:Zn finger protein HypA/HybF involved in hydrogenase expression